MRRTAGLKENMKMEPAHWGLLDMFPKAVTDFPAELFSLPTVLDEVGARPMSAFYALTNFYKRPEVFTPLMDRWSGLFENDGFVLLSMMWFIAHLRVALDLEHYQQKLIEHPLHALWWANRMKDKAYGAAVLSWAKDNQTKSSAAAWAVVVADQLDPNDFREVLRHNALYMAASGAVFDMRFDVTEYPARLTGRELYLLLRNNACHEVHETEIQLAATDPFWFFEWLVDSEQFHSETHQALLHRSSARFRNHAFGPTLLQVIREAPSKIPKRKSSGGSNSGSDSVVKLQEMFKKFDDEHRAATAPDEPIDPAERERALDDRNSSSMSHDTGR